MQVVSPCSSVVFFKTLFENVVRPFFPSCNFLQRYFRIDFGIAGIAQGDFD